MSSLWFLALQRCWVKVALGVFMTQRALHLCIFFLSVHLVKTGFFFSQLNFSSRNKFTSNGEWRYKIIIM